MTRNRQQWAYFVAAMSVALVLGPSLAHLFELPNKMVLDERGYFLVQNIYRGWSLFAVVVVAELVSIVVLMWLLRRESRALLWAGLALACVLGAQALFWTFTFPANQATANWAQAPENWHQLRLHWEYSHAAAAIFNLGAMAALLRSMLVWGGAKRDG